MISNAVGSDCSLERQDILTDLLRRFKSIISTGSHNLGKTSNIEHNIDTGDQPAVRSGLRRISFHEREQINKMLKNGIIERSDSPWASPVVLVKKKDDTVRFCIDYRRLNAITRKDAYPLPRIDDTLESLSGAKVFSTIDLATGYSQVNMAENDKAKNSIRVAHRVIPVCKDAFRSLQCTFNLPKIDGECFGRSHMERMLSIPR
jgi:hypothetical protein